MSETDEKRERAPAPKRPGTGDDFSHRAFAFQRIGRKFGRYLEVGVARVPPCPHCGAPPDDKVKVFLNRLPIGGFSGGLLLAPHDTQPPQLKPEQPGQGEVNEDELLPDE